jgi:hypothetical protein
LGEFIVFVSTLFFFGTASAFVVHYFRRQNRKLDSGVDHQVLARLLEDTDTLSSRLDRVEEELEFFRRLNSPEARDEISPPKEERKAIQGPPSTPEGTTE